MENAHDSRIADVKLDSELSDCAIVFGISTTDRVVTIPISSATALLVLLTSGRQISPPLISPSVGVGTRIASR